MSCSWLALVVLPRVWMCFVCIYLYVLVLFSPLSAVLGTLLPAQPLEELWNGGYYWWNELSRHIKWNLISFSLESGDWARQARRTLCFFARPVSTAYRCMEGWKTVSCVYSSKKFRREGRKCTRILGWLYKGTETKRNLQLEQSLNLQIRNRKALAREGANHFKMQNQVV